MTRKVPDDAFAFWVALGMHRTYGQVGRHYGVTPRTIVKVASREHWQARLAEIELAAREVMDAALAQEKGESMAQHRRLIRAIAARAGKALADIPLATGMEGVRAAEIAIKLDRLVSGDSTAQTAVVVENVTRQEMDRFLKPSSEDLELDDDPDPDDAGNDW